MAEYKPITVKFQNKGIVQRVDADFLTEGMFYDMLNTTSIHEGTIASRLGSQRKSQGIGNLIHTMEVFRIDANPSRQYLYLGEGTDIHRLRMDALGGSPVNMGAAMPVWGQKWSSVKFNAGSAGKPYFFVAGGRMLKDYAVNQSGVETTGFTRWGILPPPAAPTATVASEVSVSIFSGTASVSWTGSESYLFKGSSGVGSALTITTTPVDLSRFASNIPSGSASNGYDSDDVIELTMTLSNQYRFEQFILEFDTNNGTWLDYYAKTIVPTRETSARADSSPVVLTDASGSSTPDPAYEGPGYPVEIPPGPSYDSSGVTYTITVRKRDFEKIGAAGESGHTWADVKQVRLWAKSADVTDVGASLTVTSLKMMGGSGPDTSAVGAVPYDYVYTYRNDATGHESNPSPLMVESRYVKDVRRTAITLSGIVTPTDTQVTSIGIYRRGGTIGNDFRLVGYIAANETTFTDTLSDSDLIYSRSCEFDNDPPVTSKMPVALSATFTGSGTTGTQSVSLAIQQPSGMTAEQCLTVGTRLLVQDNERTEYVQISAVTGNTITVNFQAEHYGTIRVTTSSVVGKACRLAAVVGSSVFLAGDSDNPNVLYKSKAGRPEAFPVTDEAAGTVNQILVGSPANPIMGLAEFNGECLCLNRHGLFVVRVFNGQMGAPLETPAQRGLICERGWCKADNEIFYLSDDGVYSWSGGVSKKRSEQVDWFFKGQTVNGIAPLDKSESALSYVSFAYHQNELHITCRDTTGNSVKWIYNTIYDRWERHLASREGGDASSWTILLNHDGSLYSARSLTSGSNTTAYVYQENIGSSDNGYPIIFEAQTGFYALGSPSLQKQWGDIVLELTCPVNLTVYVYYDFSLTPVETHTITGASGRRRVPIPFNSGNAKEAYAIGFKFTGEASAAGQIILHSITFTALELSEIQRGRASDWKDYGYPYDKRLDQLIIEYDTGGQTVTLNMDIIEGVNGNTQTIGIASFTLSGNGRSKATLPIKSTSGQPVIAKMVRLRPNTTSADFKIFSDIITYEKLPPDITLFTEPHDYGSPYDKYFQQLVIDIDTGNVAATIDVYIDNGTTPAQSFSVTTNRYSRQRNLVMHKEIMGKKAWLKLTPGAGGKTQLFSHNFIAIPADKGPVLHSYDWDDLGTPNDKRLYWIFIEYEVTQTCTLAIDGLSGIGSNQSVSRLMTITLEPGGRKKHQAPFPDGTLVKMIRVYPVYTDEPPQDAKIYKYEVQKEVLPPDITPFTPLSDLGYKCEKVFRTATLDIDTGGVNCTATFEVDGADVASFTVNSTANDRLRTVSFVSDIENTVVIGRLVRWKFQAGTGGKSQYFNADYEFTTEPCPMTFFDTFEQFFGSNGFKYIRQIWLEYRSTGSVRVKIYRDNGELFYEKDLPQHTHRDIERFYLPVQSGGRLNKSHSYRITVESIEADAVFYLYRDSSRVESMALSGDIRAPFNQHYIFSYMPIQK